MSWLRHQFRTFEKLFVAWRINTTAGGKAVSFAMIVCTPELLSNDSSLLIVFATMFSLLVVTGTTAAILRPRVVVSVLAANAAQRNATVELRYTIRNTGTRPCLDLLLDLAELPECWEVIEGEVKLGMLASGSSKKVTLVIRATRRGLFQLPSLRVRSIFPLGMFRLGRVYPVRGELAVWPSYTPLAEFELAQLPPVHFEEQHLEASKVGHGWEYIGSREYLPGLPVRRWDYSSWARLNRPVVREYNELHQPSAGIIVDTAVEPAGDESTEPEPLFESALSLAAAVSECIISHGSRLDLFAVGDSVRSLIQVSPARQHQVIMYQLAAAQPATDRNAASLGEQFGHGSATLPDVVYLLTTSSQTGDTHLLDRLRAGGCRIVRILVTCEDGGEVARWNDLMGSGPVINTGSVAFR